MADQVHTVARPASSLIRAGALALLAAGILLPDDGLRSQTPASVVGHKQDPQSAKPRMAVDEAAGTIVFSMGESEGMELIEFIKWGQAVTGKRFTFSPEELQRAGAGDNTVSFLGTLRIKRKRFAEDFLSFFQTMLYIKGFAVVRRGEGDLEVLEIKKSVAGAGENQQPQNLQRGIPNMVVDEATDTIALSMAGSEDMELIDFIKWGQEVTGKRFTFSRSELQRTGAGDNTVSFLGTFRIKRKRFVEDFFLFFQTMLYTKGFAVVPHGEGDLEMHEIVRMAGPRKR